jgi:hypothetical protein
MIGANQFRSSPSISHNTPPFILIDNHYLENDILWQVYAQFQPSSELLNCRKNCRLARLQSSAGLQLQLGTMDESIDRKK